MAAAAKALAGAALIGGVVYLATRKAKAEPAQPLPEGTGDALRAMLETRIVNGQRVQYFKVPVIRDAIMNMLTASTLAPHTQSGVQLGLGPATAVFLVLEGSGPVTAAQAVNAAISTQNLAVLGSLTLPIPARVPRLVATVPPVDRVDAAEGSAWAVLADPGGVLPPLATGPSPGDVIPPGGDVPLAGGLDANMPANVQAQVNAMLTDPDADPEALEQAADMLEDQFPIAAQRLRERAAELRLREKLEHFKLGGSPFVVREGDLPSVVAKHYTGNGLAVGPGNWREIAEVPRNAERGMAVIIKDGQPWGLSQWIGEVLLPLSWKVWEKPLPPRKTGGGAQKPDVKETDPDLQALADQIAQAAQSMGGGLQPVGSALASNKPSTGHGL